VLSPAELQSRFNVQEEQYLTAVDIERDTLRLIVNEMVMPAALAERGELAIGAKALADLSLDCSLEKGRIEALNQAVMRLKERGDAVGALAEEAGHDAHKVADMVVPALAEVRAVVDELEGLVSDGRWPMPKYRELLFMI
jgi:glutamine synthetase